MNPAKYLRWSFWEKFLQNAPPIFGKHSILVVRQGSEYASVMKHFKVLIKPNYLDFYKVTKSP